MSKDKSPAQIYRELKAKLQANEQGYDVACPSGMIFKCVRPNLRMYMASGKLPQFLQNQMAIVQAAGGDFEDKIKNDPELQEKIINNSIFIRNLILQNVRSPKIVEVPSDPDNEIGFDDLVPEDYDFLSRWMISGVGGDSSEVKAAETFRQK